MDKECSCCGLVKSQDHFYTGRGKCKPCFSEQQKQYLKNNPEKRKSTAKEWVAANKEKVLIRKYAWRKENISKVNAQLRERYRKKRDELLAYQAIWRNANPLKRSAIQKKWNKKNIPVINAATARRRAKKLSATPSWANNFFIEEAYRLAILRTKMTGVHYQVDHIVPLQSKIVCGLHVHENMQVIPKIENIKKGNHAWEDMP